MNFMMTCRALLETTHAFKWTELQSLYKAANMPESMKTKYKIIWNGNINIHLTNNVSDCSVSPKHGDITKGTL